MEILLLGFPVAFLIGRLRLWDHMISYTIQYYNKQYPQTPSYIDTIFGIGRSFVAFLVFIWLTSNRYNYHETGTSTRASCLYIA